MNKMKKVNALLLAAMLGTGLSVSAAEIVSLPAAPSNLTAVVVSADEVSLSWYDNSADSPAITIQRSEDGMSWEVIGEISVDTGEFRDVEVEPEVRYLYRVFAHNASGESSFSNQDVVITPPQLDFQLDARYFHVGAIFGQ